MQERAFLMQRNFRRFKQDFQIYQEDPCPLAETINWFLSKEQEILEAAELANEVQRLEVQQSSMELEKQRLVEKNIIDFKNKVQAMEYSLRGIEEQQDEFDFKYQTHKMDGTADAAEKNEQVRVLQQMINRINESRMSFLSQMSSLLESFDSLLCMVLEELEEWKSRQQISCIGAPDDTNLEPLEKWFTQLGEGGFQLRKFLEKLEELQGKLSYEQDPIKVQKPILQEQLDLILTSLLKSAFIVETQPSMPQGRGPLVLRTNVQFSVKTRFLFKVPELNHAMKVTVSIDKEVPQVKGYRRFNVLGTLSKVLNMSESMNGGMVADFRHLTLKEQKVGGGGKGTSDMSLSVTEELHVIHLETQFDLHGLSVSLETSTLPVVVISNSSQQQSAWASVLWFNMLRADSKNLLFFASSPTASWSQFGEMLSWQFLSCGKRGLNSDQLDTIAQKLFGKQKSYDNCKISWTKFSKENIRDTNFTLWVWMDGILNLVKLYLADLWHDGSIMGFITKAKEKSLLKGKQCGTFLLRFSESIKDGGITFSWVEYSNDGKHNVRTVQPFISADLKQIPFPEILRNFQIMEAENAPVYPLQFLYPNIPKAQAIGKYYNEKTGEASPYIKYIKTKLVFVSKENGCTNVVEGPPPGMCAQHNDPSEANEDVMSRGPGNSPMLSSCTSSPVLSNGFIDTFQHFSSDDPNVLTEGLLDINSDAFVAVGGQDPFQDSIPGAISPEADLGNNLPEFLHDTDIFISFQEFNFLVSQPLSP
ncbi:signal transducer and activator of transcription 2 isoform X2 [Electrophorus electricus]|nr:signal transducer and activator of transcription 2 isoform X2 [Electrophorus electricus]